VNTVHDYESLAYMGRPTHCPIWEAWRGTDIVRWFGQIERQLEDKLKEMEASRNFDYAGRIRKYLEIWRSNEITGSINRETLEVLKAPLEVMAIESWSQADYFGNLRDRLRTLIAAEEELPRGTEMDTGGEPMGGGGAGGRGAPPLSPSFGPEDEAPGEPNPEEMGAEGGAPHIEEPGKPKPGLPPV